MKRYLITLHKHGARVGCYLTYATSNVHATEIALHAAGVRSSALDAVNVQRVTDRTPFAKLATAEIL